LAGKDSRLSLHPAYKKRGCSLKAATVNGERKTEKFEIKFAGLNNTLIFAARSTKREFIEAGKRGQKNKYRIKFGSKN
jgi:hypothetical protein